VSEAYPGTLFITDWKDLDLAKLPGRRFCLSPRPDTAVPIVMQALEMWTARPYSTTVIVLIARDFGTKGLRSLLRQFDEVSPGKRYQRLIADGDECIWDTMLMVKSPKAPPKVGSKELRAAHDRLVLRRRQSEREERDWGNPADWDPGRGMRKGERYAQELWRMQGARGDCSEPEGADRAYELGLGAPGGPERSKVAAMRDDVRPRRTSAKPVDPVGEMLRLHRRLDELQSGADERNGNCLDELQALGLRGEGRHRPTRLEEETSRSHEKGNALRDRRLTGAKWARKCEVLRCGKCGHSDLSTELFACRYRDEGAVTRRHGRLPSSRGRPAVA
jgi:hypothetical protein